MQRLIFGTRAYQWFERLVVAILTLMVAVSVILTLVHSGFELYHVATTGPTLFDHNQFIKVFAAFMTVLIALEFNHTVLPDISEKKPVVKVRAVLLVAMLALARKVVLVDFKKVSYTSMIGLAVLIVCVSVAYWVIRQEEMAKGE
ncbi:MAG: phosphate-starvation-inducible PsiE family protein [Geothermobacteraceae bacterium]